MFNGLISRLKMAVVTENARKWATLNSIISEIYQLIFL